MKLVEDKKGQINAGAIIGILLVVVVIAISQVVTTNVLNVAGLNSGLWTLLATIWPLIAVIVLLSVVGLIFVARR